MLTRVIGETIRLKVQTSSEPMTVMADPGQLEQVLLNLCINARDAMPEGGRLVIQTANCTLDAQSAAACELEPGDYVSLGVTDTGCGMGADVMARAFDPFFTTKPLGQGTGLGLSMIYGFARQSGGQVRIRSELGNGTTVSLYLARHHHTPIEAEAKAPSTPAYQPGASVATILVVEDEPSIRELVHEALTEAGYTLLQAGDSTQGLQILQSSASIDLLITDVGLPGTMNGRQMADVARTSRPGLKIMFMTGYAESAALGSGALARDMHVLIKPFSMRDLHSRIRDILGG
jgi:CheY-like chemotaxis protein